MLTYVKYAPLFARSQLQNSYRYVNFSILMLNRKVGHFFCGVEWQALKSHFNTSKICLEQDSQWGSCFFLCGYFCIKYRASCLLALLCCYVTSIIYLRQEAILCFYCRCGERVSRSPSCRQQVPPYTLRICPGTIPMRMTFLSILPLILYR